MELQHRVSLLEKLAFGPRRERFITDTPDNQLKLEVATRSVAEVEVRTTTIKEHDRKKVKVTPKVHPGRHSLPKSFRRMDIHVNPSEDVSGSKVIGEEVTEVLEVTQAEFYVKRYIRKKYAGKDGEGVMIGTLPKRVIDKGIAGPSVLALLIISKFIDHLPVYRQIAIFKRLGISLHYNTVLDWTNHSVDALTPLYDLLKRRVLESRYIKADETGIKVLNGEKQGSSHQGFLWAYQDALNNLILFEYQPGRGKSSPGEMLKNFQGYLQTDGYAAYDQFASKKGITILHCMAHARRYFKEAQDNDKKRADFALKVIQKLYETERDIKEAGAEDRLRVRQENAVPLLKELGDWMVDQYKQVTPRSPIGKALEYALKRWKELSAYTSNASLDIDNNSIENTIRPIALGRKNYLFAGSNTAAQRIAMIYSLLGTCKAHGVDPMKWITHVLQEIPNRTINNLDDLMPQNCLNL